MPPLLYALSFILTYLASAGNTVRLHYGEHGEGLVLAIIGYGGKYHALAFYAGYLRSPA